MTHIDVGALWRNARSRRRCDRRAQSAIAFLRPPLREAVERRHRPAGDHSGAWRGHADQTGHGRARAAVHPQIRIGHRLDYPEATTLRHVDDGSTTKRAPEAGSKARTSRQMILSDPCRFCRFRRDGGDRHQATRRLCSLEKFSLELSSQSQTVSARLFTTSRLCARSSGAAFMALRPRP